MVFDHALFANCKSQGIIELSFMYLMRRVNTDPVELGWSAFLRAYYCYLYKLSLVMVVSLKTIFKTVYFISLKAVDLVQTTLAQ